VNNTSNQQLPYSRGYSDPPKSEKIAGKIYAMAGGTYKHADAVSNIHSVLSTFFHGKPCKAYTSELDIYLDTANNYRPDISVICDFSKMKDDGYHGAPTLVVEALSPSTARFDRGEKFDCYEKNGVQEYWLVNPEFETIEQYALIGGKFEFQAIHFKRETKYNSYVFPDLEISLNDVFNYPI
jgi:Uma2 family endonuclease